MANEEYDYNFYQFNDKAEHPQFDILKKHIERAVQDLFLDSLRSQSTELLYVFTDEGQIDVFVKRILRYWEEFEDYEICQEVISLSKKFKRKWKNRNQDESSIGLDRIRDLFNSKK
jgi:hypothetical protein